MLGDAIDINAIPVSRHDKDDVMCIAFHAPTEWNEGVLGGAGNIKRDEKLTSSTSSISPGRIQRWSGTALD